MAMNDFLDELESRSECELMGGGPLDGTTFRWPDSQHEATFQDTERPGIVDIYTRIYGTNQFQHQGQRQADGA